MIKKKKRPKNIHQGDWVYDMPKGMTKPDMPKPLPNKKLSIKDLKEYVAYEGIGYCISEYIPPTKIEDVELRKLWNSAKRDINKIVEYLYK